MILVEGILDHHHLHARGITNTAALGGTATRSSLFDDLARHGVEEVTLLLDADQAGHDATCRAIDHAVHSTTCPDLTVVRLNDENDNDPDQYLRNGNAAELRATIETRVSAITWQSARTVSAWSNPMRFSSMITWWTLMPSERNL